MDDSLLFTDSNVVRRLYPASDKRKSELKQSLNPWLIDTLISIIVDYVSNNSTTDRDPILGSTLLLIEHVVCFVYRNAIRWSDYRLCTGDPDFKQGKCLTKAALNRPYAIYIDPIRPANLLSEIGHPSDMWMW